MYSGIQKIEEVIDSIEADITAEVDCDALAAKMNLSVYEFRRIFAFIVGCPISEYVRRRRLSLAACEILLNERVDMLALSEKYGYSSQSAFTKAFGEQHGVSPTAYLKEKNEINLFTRPKFDLHVGGGENIPFRLVREEAFTVYGFSAVSPMTDTCCCEEVWNAFYEAETDRRLQECGLGEKIIAVYQNTGGNVVCTIGAASRKGLPGMAAAQIPVGRWACYRLNTVDDDVVNGVYSKILYEWLPSANLRQRSDVPVLEVYPFDMTEDGFTWEIRIPVCE